MRIAIISDIHGNLIALDAVLADVAAHAPDEVWCGGDVAWSGPWASECIARVRSEGWPTVRGNTDVWITGDPQTVTDENERRDVREFAAGHGISEDDAQWLVNLPLGHSGPGSVLLVHGTPESPFTAPLPDSPTRDFDPYLGRAAIVVYGHVHMTFMRRLRDGTIVCNTGSVGLPMDSPFASYLLIDLNGTDWTLRHRRVAFDRDRALREARAIGGAVAQRFTSILESGKPPSSPAPHGPG